MGRVNSRGPGGAAQVSRRRERQNSGRSRRRVPRQERSIETVDVILEGAAQVFAKWGYARATTNKIAERAGVSIGSLYQYFSNKDDIMQALLARHQREIRDVIASASAKLADPEIPLSEGFRDLLNGMLEFHSRDPELNRVLAHGIHRPKGRGGHKHGEWEEEDEHYVTQVKGILDSRPEVQVDDTEMASRVVVQTVALLIRWLGHEAPPGLDAKAFVDEVLAMLVGYLSIARYP